MKFWRGSVFCGLFFLANLGGGPSALAASVAFDFGWAGHSTVQPGFTALQGNVQSTNSVSASSAGLDVTVSFSTATGNVGFYDRGALSNSGSFTYADLYNGFAYTNDTSPVHISIANITPNVPYAITLYSYDPVLNVNSSETTTFTTANQTTGGPASVTYGTTPPTSNNEFSTTMIVKSTSSALDILAQASPVAPTQDGTRVNGFALAPVPEPSAMLLCGAAAMSLGSLGLWQRLRRACQNVMVPS